MQAPLPPDEADRLAALESQKITDTGKDDSCDRIVRLACTATATLTGAITFIEDERQWLKAAQNMGEKKETRRRDVFCAYALHGDEVLVVEDASQDPASATIPWSRRHRFYAGAPLVNREGFILGTLCVIDQIPRRIGSRDVGLLQDMAAIVVDELDLRRRAGTDPLTGLYTRRFLDEIALHEVARARRLGTPLTAAMIDIDRFKSINDSFGHPAELMRDDEQIDDVLGRADIALYRAKESGRNRVELAIAA